MSSKILRLLFLAPAATFGLGAAFVASSFALGIAPQSSAVWRTFLTLTPLTRDPVNLIDSIPGVGYGLTFIFFSVITAAALLMAFTSWGSDRLRYGAAHLAFMTVLYSMGHVAKTYSSIAAIEPVPFFGRFDWVINSSPPSLELTALLILVGAACLLTHAVFIGRVVAQFKSHYSINRHICDLVTEFRN